MKIILCLFILSASYLTASDCPRADNPQKCLGECGAFSDSNRNKICDDWEKINNAKKDKKPVKEQKKDALQEAKVEKKSFSAYDRLVKYGLFWFFLAPCFAVLASERLKKNPGYFKIHRDVWNNVLFLSFFLCSLSGFALYFFNLGGLKNIFFKAHLFSGAVCFIASLYHFLERYSCMFPFCRK